MAGISGTDEHSGLFVARICRNRWALEKLIDLASKVSFENLAAGAKGLVSLIPGGGQAIAGLMDIAGIGGGEKSEVNGTITVRAEPGTKAKVEQPRLPTGNNVRLAGAR